MPVSARRLGRAARSPRGEPGPGYKWVALSNTTLGSVLALINLSILLIALPDIFRGIGVNPLRAGNTSLLLWLILGYLVVTTVLVVSFGRLGDMFGRVRIYNLGFAVFTVFSVLLAVTWLHGTAGALWLIVMRILQGVGGAMLMANSAAILTDAFPLDQRGLALGLNQVASIAGQFIGLVVGGLLGPVDWHLVFAVSVPFGTFGTFWAYRMLRDLGERRPARLDWWGNLTFAVGLIAVLAGITYGIQPYGGHSMGWSSPWVIGCLAGGAAVLILFCFVETRVAEPMFDMGLFRIRAFSAGSLAGLLSALARGGLMFIVIIWLQGIYLPRHGYGFSQTPLWAGIYLLPLTAGFLLAGPVSGALSDRFGARPFATGGMVVAAGSFLLLDFLPVDFAYWQFALILLLNGIGNGLFIGRRDEQPAARAPRRRRRHGDHLPECRHRAVHRILLHAGHPGPGGIASGHPVARADRARRAAGRRGARRRAAPGVGAVRRAAWVQPGAHPARRRAWPPGAGQRCLPDRAQLLPRADQPSVRTRAVAGVRVRRGSLPRSGPGFAAAGRQVCLR